uniref:Disintegrin domain-containing protein n=1 Tax=Labrus bergylta TaxID=56723 RepID=A0A3Q3ELX8_9LABR
MFGVYLDTRNPCCDASTCRLTEGSQCAHGLCCDNCQVNPANTIVCRKTSRDCDLPEYCTGVSQDCPEDRFEMNGKEDCAKKCNNNGVRDLWKINTLSCFH